MGRVLHSCYSQFVRTRAFALVKYKYLLPIGPTYLCPTSKCRDVVIFWQLSLHLSRLGCTNNDELSVNGRAFTPFKDINSSVVYSNGKKSDREEGDFRASRFMHIFWPNQSNKLKYWESKFHGYFIQSFDHARPTNRSNLFVQRNKHISFIEMQSWYFVKNYSRPRK